MKITIKNFQSIQYADIYIGPFTAIIGSSDSGKSAVVRAIAACLFNTPGSKYITWGAKETIVTIDDGDNKIKYTKDPSPTYEINGKKYSPGRGMFEGVKSLGYSELSVDGRKMRPQVSGQHDKAFLISNDYSPTSVASLLGNLSDSVVANKAKRLVEKDLKQVVSMIKIREKDLAKSRMAPVLSVDFDTLSKKLSQIDSYEQNSTEIEAEQDALEYTLNDIKRIKIQIDQAEAMQDALPDIDNIYLRCEQLEDVVRKQEAVVEQVKEWKLLQKIVLTYMVVKDKVYALLNRIFSILKKTEKSIDDVEKLQYYKNAAEDFRCTNLKCMAAVDGQHKVDKELAKFTSCPVCGGRI